MRRPFLASRRRLLDLVVMLILAVVLGFALNLDTALLFSFGFIWNWVAGQDLTQHMEGRKYRYTMLKFVFNLQTMVLSPSFIQRLPEPVKLVIRSLPAGIFWTTVILLQQSDLPYWAVFVGSLSFELSQWELFFRKKASTP